MRALWSTKAAARAALRICSTLLLLLLLPAHPLQVLFVACSNMNLIYSSTFFYGLGVGLGLAHLLGFVPVRKIAN